MSTLMYLKNFMKDRYVASITPTSPFGVRSVCGKIDFGRSDVIVEYGAGTGVFTRHLLHNMPPSARLIVIERNPEFNSILQGKFRDPRVAIVNDSAENVLETLKQYDVCQVDCVISGIPFLWLGHDIKHKILCNTHRILKDQGKFLAYQTFFQTSKDLKVHMDRYFRTVRVNYEFMNIPPLCIYEAVK
jgi:phospholipid N-methyltransferase